MKMLTFIVQPVTDAEAISEPLLHHLRVHFEQFGNLREH